jgi:hypothetical protein
LKIGAGKASAIANELGRVRENFWGVTNILKHISHRFLVYFYFTKLRWLYVKIKAPQAISSLIQDYWK